ncbi:MULTISPECIES: hypothetical protein [unclassified Stenotrophomonas]|uniref:hypothetical protein n=1 Tax=unclassified Stenotrophomonas TaxID=196198 RepID=UPI00244D3EBF|nr:MULTISPECIES: hypothetical protein [unclassified Stenotrophomonas]MDG9843084.1 hypothetical protein [Stenotrophomonas sp. GD04054]MDH0015876.1 hypothetical protein [Stenotrophomonas sp. GD04028]MDH0575660.1 hypothetical protein [Stenotrophomonas sp. GD03997]MDH0859580.1 hypothetical protein [Stenotrophomonas sp. GD03882]
MYTSEKFLYGAIVFVFVCVIVFFAAGASKSIDQQMALVNQMSVTSQAPMLQNLDALDAERREQAERLAQR